MSKTKILRRSRFRCQILNFGHFCRTQSRILGKKVRILKNKFQIKILPGVLREILVFLKAHVDTNTQKQKLRSGRQKTRPTLASTRDFTQLLLNFFRQWSKCACSRFCSTRLCEFPFSLTLQVKSTFYFALLAYDFSVSNR